MHFLRTFAAEKLLKLTCTMKKVYTTILAAMLTMAASTIFTSCNDQDDFNFEKDAQTTPADGTTACHELAKELVGTRMDLSNVLLGNDVLDIWKIAPDGSLTLYKVDPTQEDNAITDSLKGTWKPFAGIDDPWDATGTAPKRNGFFATFKGEEAQKLDLGEDEVTLTYFADRTEDDSLYIVSRDYVNFMYMKYGDTAMTRSGISNFFAKVRSSFSNAWKKVKTVMGNLFNVDRNLTNNTSESQAFWKQADEVLSGIRGDSGREQTDYSHWMGDIYGTANPRICDMNIPGSHDSFTYSYKLSITAKYAACQKLNFDEQWQLGIRAFDIRFKEDGYIYHMLSTHQTVDAALDRMVHKLKANPTETAIVFLQPDGDKTDKKYNKIVEIVRKYKDYIVTSPRPDLRLDECRGKMVLFQDWDYCNEHPDQRVAPTMESIYNGGGESRVYYFGGKSDVYNYDTGYPTITRTYYQNKCQQESYESTAQFWADKKRLMKECFEATAATKGQDEPVWAVNMASGNVGGLYINLSYAKNANVMNPYAFNYVVNNKAQKMNIIMMDFAGYNGKFDGYHCNGEKLPEAIVLTNKFL